jgi:hypothetical protein
LSDNEGQEVMNETHQPRQALRSVGAVLVGMLTGIILSLGTDELLHLAHVFPPWDQRASDGLLLLATIYRTIYGVAGSFIAARLAPHRPMLHAMILGVFGLAASAAGAVVTWNKGSVFGPHWYPVALVVLAIPTAWAGGKIRLVQLRARADG